MPTYSTELQLTLQNTGENPDTWGTVHNSQVTQLIEEALAGFTTLSPTSGINTLSAVPGGSDTRRHMMIDLTGDPSGNAQLEVPATAKLWLFRNSTSGGHTITVRVAGQTGVDLPAATSTILVYCDGTDCYTLDIENAINATNATTATNSTQLGGVAASSYARLDEGGTDQSFTQSQNTTRVALTAGLNVAVNANSSNSFYLQPNQAFTLSNPTGAVNGTTIRIVIEQPAGANYAITWGSAYKFAGGLQPTLTAVNGAIDYFCFERFDATTWIGGGLLDVK